MPPKTLITCALSCEAIIQASAALQFWRQAVPGPFDAGGPAAAFARRPRSGGRARACLQRTLYACGLHGGVSPGGGRHLL